VRLPWLGWLALAVVALVILSASVVIVPENTQAIITRLGKPDRIANEYDPAKPIGNSGAGLTLKVPFIENVIFVDKRIRDLDMPSQTVLSIDQRRLVVDAFARYRIVDPLRMYVTRGSAENVATQLSNVLASRLRNELANQPFAALLSPERGELMENIQRSVNREAGKVGVEIVDLRIKRADLPLGAPLESAYGRMRAARNQESLTILAQGQKQAQLITADADATAAKIYAESFGQDAEFYGFYRAMQAYRAAFADGRANLVLSPDNEFLKEFEGRSARR
jgi:membrane protease subunit HflC